MMCGVCMMCGVWSLCMCVCVCGAVVKSPHSRGYVYGHNFSPHELLLCRRLINTISGIHTGCIL